MEAARTGPDVMKVFTAIATIMSHRGDAAKVTLVDIKKKQEVKKSA